jgi:hypothetical protein
MNETAHSITTSPRPLGHLSDLNQMMKRNEIIMVYAGEFSQALTKTLLSFTERRFTVEKIEDTVKRKIFNIMVELLQNVSKNALDNDVEFSLGSPVFMIGEGSDSYFLISSNKIKEDDMSKIKARIDEINSLDSEGLKKLYKQVRISGTFSELGGAGIGFIDMARKSENKIEYNFSPFSEGFVMFSLCLQISKQLERNLN